MVCGVFVCTGELFPGPVEISEPSVYDLFNVGGVITKGVRNPVNSFGVPLLSHCYGGTESLGVFGGVLVENQGGFIRVLF